MRCFLVLTALGLALFLSGPTARAADESCAGCERVIQATGDFQHYSVNENTPIRGVPPQEAPAYREELYGQKFSIVVPNLEAGKYTLRLGFAETWATNAGERIFDVTCGDTVIASNLDLVAEVGPLKVHRASVTIDHPGDAVAGPVTLTFTGKKQNAKFNTLEVRDDHRTVLVSAQASDLVPMDDADLMKAPVVEGPEIWKDPAQPRAARVADLVSRMSISEKIVQMNNTAPANRRLGIPAYNYWNECLHGVARAGTATVFPQAIGMAATWDTPLLHDIADTIATEARAKHNQYVAEHDGDCAQYFGLTFWTPNINIFRDPRWGRGQETYGEDPFLTARLAVSFIRGLQGDDPKYVKAMACVKHFAVHSGPESSRHTFNAEPTARDFYETYLPHFEAAVREGHVGAVMGAYNRVLDDPACASELLLKDLLRDEWHFDGHVVSDCGAITDIYANHKVADNVEEAAALAVQAGCDLCCGTDYRALARAVKKDLLDPDDIDTALGRLLDARFRLGMFDPTNLVPYAQIGIDQNNTPEHAALALRAARESLVLLKNDGVLPLRRKKIKQLLVLGANADSVPMQLGNYNGSPSSPVSILEGIRQLAGTNVQVDTIKSHLLAVLRDSKGYNFSNDIATAVAAATNADAIIYVGGISPQLEGEEMRVNYDGFSGGDRTRIELPELQTEFLKALHATGRPVIFVDCSGSAIAMPWEAENLPAIVQAWYPGQAGGTAVAELLFGLINPAGRLPVTFYRSTQDLPDFTDYSMKNRTYRYFSGKPLFAFGHGLSYSKFKYTNTKLASSKVAATDTLKLTVDVKNSGDLDGDEVVQVYFRHVNSAMPQAREALCGFRRVSIPAGKTVPVSIDIPVNQFRFYDPVKKQYVVEPGMYQLLVGGASDNIRTRLPVLVR